MNSMNPIPTSEALRVVFPQWQACGADYAEEFTQNLTAESVRHGYEHGADILNHIFPDNSENTVFVPVANYDGGVEQGIESRSAVLENLRAATKLIADRDPSKIVTFGGDCSVNVPSATHLAAKYGDDLAIVWLDSHPDCSLPGGIYQGYHDMALSHIMGKGDPEFLELLPGSISPNNVVLAGTHSWNADEHENFVSWGIKHLSPQQLQSNPELLIEWLESTGCNKVALHVDVDSVDARQFHLGMGAETEGLTKSQVQSLIATVSNHKDLELVGFSVGEFIPRQVLAVRELFASVPLV